MKFTIIFLAVVVVVELVRLVGMDRYAEQFSVSIESTEFGQYPWPAQGDQTGVAGERSNTSSSPRIYDGKPGVAGDHRATF